MLTPIRRIVRRPSVLACVLLVLEACSSVDEPAEVSAPYRSIWAEMYPDTLRNKATGDTLQGAFFIAAGSAKQAAAEQRWRAFLSDWAPAGGGFDDAMHARLVTWARLELQRLEHLQRDEHAAANAAGQKLRQFADQIE